MIIEITVIESLIHIYHPIFQPLKILMKNKVCFFDLDISGHHLEYLHHISQHAEQLNANHIVFIVNYGFVELYQQTFGLNLNRNIVVLELSSQDSALLNTRTGFSKVYFKFILLRKYLKMAEGVKTCFLMQIEPLFWIFLSIFFINVNFSGILLNTDILGDIRFKNKIKRGFLSLSLVRNKWKKIFLLNNIEMVNRLNQKFASKPIFFNLTDPLLDLFTLKLSQAENIHSFSGKLTFLHPGAISDRKGTLEILQALKELPSNVSGKIEIVIAGNTAVSYELLIKQEIKQLSDMDIKNVYFYNKMLSLSEFDFLFKGCDYLIIPYKRNNLSSGIIAHAINYGKPVIGPRSGLMQKIIEEYGAGICIDVNSSTIAKTLTNLSTEKLKITYKNRERFISLHSPLDFITQISQSL